MNVKSQQVRNITETEIHLQMFIYKLLICLTKRASSRFVEVFEQLFILLVGHIEKLLLSPNEQDEHLEITA